MVTNHSNLRSVCACAEYLCFRMALQRERGAALQGYNDELTKCIEELRSKREALKKQILQEEEEKHKIENDPHTPTDELSHVNESLASKIAAKKDYDKTIAETETAYKKILESSETLLHTLKQETIHLKDTTDHDEPSANTTSPAPSI